MRLHCYYQVVLFWQSSWLNNVNLSHHALTTVYILLLHFFWRTFTCRYRKKKKLIARAMRLCVYVYKHAQFKGTPKALFNDDFSLIRNTSFSLSLSLVRRWQTRRTCVFRWRRSKVARAISIRAINESYTFFSFYAPFDYYFFISWFLKEASSLFCLDIEWKRG